MKNLYIILIILINILFFTINVSNLSISYQESLLIFYEKNSFLSILIDYIIVIFGQKDVVIRGFIFSFHLLNILLIYKISKLFLKKEIDTIVSIFIYSLIPGVISFSIILNPSTVVITFTLMYIYFYLNKNESLSIFVLIISLFIDNSFYILYFTLILFSLIIKNKKLFITSLILLIISLTVFGFESGGKPKGYFLDTLGVYLGVFSPLLFLYFFYVLYRDMVLKRFNIIWAISFFTLILSLILSLRQKLILEDFVPFIVISTPLLVKSFFSSYRIRLSEFRIKYKLVAFFIIITLVFNFFILIFNQYLFVFLEDKKSHFAYGFYFVKELANELKKNNINFVYTKNKKLQTRLLFYNIKQGNNYIISSNRISNLDKIVTISNIKGVKKIYYVSKINKK